VNDDQHFSHLTHMKIQSLSVKSSDNCKISYNILK